MRKQVEESTAAESARRATGAAAERDRKGRFSARRTRATVLRLLRGEHLESVSRELGITAARAGRCRHGRGAGRPHPPGARSLTVSWRRVPESVGEAAGREDPHLAGTGATVDAGARPPGPVPRGSQRWSPSFRQLSGQIKAYSAR